MDLADLIDRNAAFTPDKPALRHQGQVWSYARLAERIAALARGMKSQLGVRRGDRVAVLALNSPDYLVLLYACARLGAMLVPLNWRLAEPEQTFVLGDAEGLAYPLEGVIDALNLDVVGAAGANQRRLIDVLNGPGGGGRRLAGEYDERNVSPGRRGQSRHGLGQAGTVGDRRDADASGHLRERGRHGACAVLMASVNRAHPMPLGQDGGPVHVPVAKQREMGVDAFGEKSSGQNVVEADVGHAASFLQLIKPSCVRRRF